MRRAILPAVLIAAFAVGSVVASGGARAAGSACPASNSPNELVLDGGSGQTGQLGKPFPENLSVRLANTNGCPLTGNLAGHTVNFDAPGSGPSGFFAGSGSREAYIGTNANGVATAPIFTANDTAGSYTVDAHSDVGSVEFSLSNTAAGLAATIAAGTGTPQEATVNSQYALPLQARITDANGNPVQGATVSFSFAPGPYGAAASFLTGGAQATANTNSDGIATSPLFAANGSPGRFTATASTTDLSTVAAFALDNHAVSNTLTAVDRPAQTATVDTRYPHPLTARFLDPSGQPLEGAGVTFTLGSAGGGGGGGGGGASAPGASFLDGSSQATVLTDANGEAVSPPFSANGTPGSFSATAAVAGVTVPLRYPLRNLAARLTGSSATQAATVGQRYRKQLIARVRGADGRPVDGATVTFTIGKSSAGATATFPDGSAVATVTTGADGRAVAPALDANTVSGAFTMVAALPGGGKPFRFTLRNRAGTPAAITGGAASGQTATVGSPLPIRLAVTVTDKAGNPVPGAAVIFTAPDAGASGYFTTRSRPHRVHGRLKPGRLLRGLRVSVKTNGKGIAIAPPFTADGSTGGYAVIAAVKGSSLRTAFSLLNMPG